MTDSILDTARLAELAEEVGADDLRFVLDMFLDEVAEAVRTLDPALAAEPYAKRMHFVRSGALNLGLAGLAAEARRQAALPDGERAGAGPALAAAIERAREALDGHLEARPAA